MPLQIKLGLFKLNLPRPRATYLALSRTLTLRRVPLRFGLGGHTRMAQVSVDVDAAGIDVLPPARGIPVTFRESFRSW